jgi:hypothetical protein
MAGKADEYRHHAQECLEAASRIHSEEERSILVHIAQTWQRLADQEEDGSRTGQPVVGQSPPPAEQPVAQQRQQVQPDEDKKE